MTSTADARLLAGLDVGPTAELPDVQDPLEQCYSPSESPP